MTVTTRTAEPDDYPAIVAVMDRWWGRAVSHALPRLFLQHFAATSRIAYDEQGLAGFLIAFPSPAEPALTYLHFVAVRPDLRRSGLARTLYQEVAGHARQSGREQLYAITAPANTASIRFHESLGFTVSDPVPDYNGPSRPMVVFRRDLAQDDPDPQQGDAPNDR